MRYQLIALAALSLESALAQPAHRHHHKARRDVQGVDWTKAVAGVDWSTVKYDNPAYNTPGKSAPVQQQKQAAKVVNVVPVPAQPSPVAAQPSPVAAQPSPVAAQPSPVAAGSDNSAGSSSSPSDVSGVIGGAKGKFGGTTPGHLMPGGTEDQYYGNIGAPYGSNMMAINTGDVDKYKYTNTFKNTGSNPLTIIIWNKNGRDGAPQSGMCEEPNMKFTVPAGQSQAVAFDENTLASFSRDCTRKAPANIPDCVWGELSFGSEMPAVNGHAASNKASGFDRSSIPGGANEVMTITCASCDQQARDDTKSAKGTNEWNSAAESYADNKNGIAAGVAHLLTEMAI
ncbi:MAG: hypothetical protein Q9168_006363 [Polycauliona sp. 1 TL-2023]